MKYDFYDRVKIFIKAGKGGNGCVSFHREKYVAKGGPDGGDGGHGGSVYFEIDKGTNTLLAFRTRRKFVAENGGDGMPSKFHGKNGEDITIPVPEGTVIRDAESGKIICDMSDREPFCAARGGKGGWGNKRFATPTRQVPNFAKSGREGEEREVILELKMLADVGLCGFPNVGKSTILSIVSEAKPKIANYHFTTLSPNLGVVRMNETDGFVIADIPGLIEGASEGEGLGHEFLRHIDRCRLLIHVVDISSSEGRDPVEDIITINRELAKYSPELFDRPQIIAANKLDIIGEDNVPEHFKQFCEENGYEVVYISAAVNHGIDTLMRTVYNKLKELPPVKIYEREFFEEVVDESDRSFTVEKKGGTFYVEGKWLVRLIDNTNFDDRESLMHFERNLRQYGVIDKLREMGAKEDDSVNIYDFEFDFIE